MSSRPTRLEDRIIAEFESSIEAKKAVIEQCLPSLAKIIQVAIDALRDGNKLIFFGNGGSAADSQHLVAEFINRFNFDRMAMPALALTTDTSVLTSIANDYSYENIFSRQIEALGQVGDVAIGITTSGNSPNVVKAIVTANEMGITTVGMTGLNGGKLKEVAEYCLQAPTNSTPRIQEVHITAGHALCDIVERELFQDSGLQLGLSRSENGNNNGSTSISKEQQAD